MESRGRPAARSWEIAAALLVLPFAAGTARGQATETLEAGDLGERGVVFESSFASRFSSLGGGGHGVGDTDGDGFDDVVLVVQETSGGPYAVVLIRGRGRLIGRHTIPGSLEGTTVFRVPESTRAATARAQKGIGDLDGDGLADLMFGCGHHLNAAGYPTGAGFLVYGSPDLRSEHSLDEIGTALRGVVLTSSDRGHSTIGISFAAPGDFDGDGHGDLAVGAPGSTNLRGQEGAGIVFILFEPGGLPPVVDLAQVGAEIPGVQIHGSPDVRDDRTIGYFGAEISPAGDVDGDGLADLLICDPEADLEGIRVYLVRGRRSLPPLVDLGDLDLVDNVSLFRLDADGRYLRSGFAGVGDLDGDGLGEIAIGLPIQFDPFRPGNSAVFVVRGGTDLPKTIDIDLPDLPLAATTFHAAGLGDLFGLGVAPAGDMNDDGVPDLFLAAPRASPRGKSEAGEAYVVYGRADYGAHVQISDPWDGIRILGEGAYNNLGRTASPAGDFDGDGSDDLLILTEQLGPVEDLSRAFLIYGTGSGPAPLVVHRVEPPQGRIRGGETVRIRGSGFADRGEPRVLFGGSPAPIATVLSGSEILVATPPGPVIGPVDVTVEFAADSLTLPNGFEYTPDFPEIDLASLGSRGLDLEPNGESSPGASASFGDLTGDGIDDLAVGSRTGTGWVVTIVRGGPGLPRSLPAFEPTERSSLIAPESAGGTAGAQVAVLGDVDGDGVGDLGIGLEDSVAGIVFGRASFPSRTTLEEELFERRAVRLERSGTRVEIAIVRLGDQDGDGLADLAVVIPAGADGLGEVIVLPGRRAWPEVLDLDAAALRVARIRGSAAGQRLGEEAASADLDGDGVLDLLLATRGGGRSGRAYVVFGGPGLAGDLDAEALVLAGGGIRLDIQDGFEHFSWLHVAAAGDTDGDGADDMLLGVEDGGESNHGAAYLVPGATSFPRQTALVEEPPAPDGIGRIFGERPQVQLGRAAPAGDFNADGLDDYLVAQQPDLVTQGWPWKLFLVLGTRGDPGTIRPPALGARGIEIVGNGTGQAHLPARDAGDLNGDGQPDFAVQGWPSAFESRPASLYIVFGPFGGTTFARGDANFDSRVEISDAIFALAWLFLGGEAPRCEDAVDADDDSTLVLTDPVYVLNHLFLGGPEPPAPYPDEGPDPTEDDLGCRGF